jgi:CRP-like cAMP-binding protein
MLLALSHRYRDGEKKLVAIPVRLTQCDLSDLIGVTRQHVSKNMALLRKAGCIEISPSHRITVLDPAILHQHCI